MSLVKTKPTSAGRRFLIKVVNPDLHKGKPHSPLVKSKKRISGRNNQGRVTMRRRGAATNATIA